MGYMDPIMLAAMLQASGGQSQGGSSGGGFPLNLGTQPASATPQPFSAFTPEMAQQAFDYYNNYGKDLNQLYGTPSYAPGGVSTQQAEQMSGGEVKAEQYVKYLISKGYSPENAQKEAQSVISNKGKKFADDKGFKQWIKDGNAEGLRASGGKIQADAKFRPGGINADPASEALNTALRGLSMQSAQAASGLPQLYAQEAQRALQAKQGIGNQVQSYIQQGFNQQGLLPSEQANLDAMKNKYLQQFTDLNKSNLQQTVGKLAGSGFSSSNLAKGALQKGVYDANSRFLTDAMGSLANQESSLLAQRAGIQGQNINNMLNSFNSLGANGGIGSVTGGITNPGNAGLFTDPQSAALAASLQQQNIGNRVNQEQMAGSVLQQPVTVVPESPGFFGNLLNTASPFMGPLGGAAAKTWGK